MILSRAEQFAALSPPQKKEILDGLSKDEQEYLLHSWAFWARPEQLVPDSCECHKGLWRTWLIMAGRGWGKTRTGAETVQEWAEKAVTEYIVMAAATAADIRDTMVEGESGVLSIAKDSFRPKYEPSKRRLTWPNGVKAQLLSADEPDTFRGPQGGKGWADEVAKWPYPEAWDQMMLGLRLGANPQVVATTTPRPTRLIRELVKARMTHVTRGSTYENRSNLAPAFFAEIIRKYEGTRLGRQELEAELLEDRPGALWNHGMIDSKRVEAYPPLRKITIAIDPAMTSKKKSNETGIIGVGVGKCSCNGVTEEHGFVISDKSGVLTPDGWAKASVLLYGQLQANDYVAEVNQGGDLVTNNIHIIDPRAPVSEVRATRGKAVRAEPIVALYEQGKVHHVGIFPELEDQMCSWDPQLDEDSPDRMDAAVWGLTHLMVQPISEEELLRLRLVPFRTA